MEICSGGSYHCFFSFRPEWERGSPFARYVEIKDLFGRFLQLRPPLPCRRSVQMMQAVARGVTSSSRASSSSSASPNSCCRKVLVDMPNALSRSNFQWRGKSVAASVPSDSSIPSEVRKRITKHERRAMIVSFVNKYQATNAGKFPSASLTRKQIGGSYYVIREILQELEYKSKISPLKERHVFPLDKVEEDVYISSDARQVPSLKKTKKSNTGAGFGEDIINVKLDKTPTDDTEVYEVSANASTEVYEVSANASTTTSAISSSRNLQVGRIVSIGSHSSQTNCTQDQPKSSSVEADSGRVDRDDLNDAKQKDTQELLGSKNLQGGTGIKLDHEEASPKNSTVWENLKSLAHGIMGFWRNK